VTLGASASYGSATLASKGATLSRIDPGLLVTLQELDEKRKAENLRNVSVTIEDLEEGQAEPAPGGGTEEED
jgi:hypothetical protein